MQSSVPALQSIQKMVLHTLLELYNPFEMTINDNSSSNKKSKLVTVKTPQRICKFNLNTEIYKLQQRQDKTLFIMRIHLFFIS